MSGQDGSVSVIILLFVEVCFDIMMLSKLLNCLEWIILETDLPLLAYFLL